jgi:hypothetical protein
MCDPQFAISDRGFIVQEANVGNSPERLVHGISPQDQ